MAEKGDADVDVHPQGAHQAAYGAHDAEDGHVPGIVEHAGAVGGHTVRIQPKISAAGSFCNPRKMLHRKLRL